MGERGPLNRCHLELLLVTILIPACLGYSWYQQQIPNGEMVPHPCKKNHLWRGVGHINVEGGAARNPFGLDFKANTFIWDKTVCEKDSDGDGLTNGEELGDPDCTWTPSTAPKYSTGLSHPGICEPLEAPHCLEKNNFEVDCTRKAFDCPVINETGTFEYTVRLPETTVPAKETTYMCMIFDFPTHDDFHLVASVPLIANADVMHHILVYGCDTNAQVLQTPGKPYSCNMDPGYSCRNIIGAWTVGSEGNCLHPNVGFNIGATGYRKGAIELHWNNPQLRNDFVDSSGLILYLTPLLRPYEAGMLTIGQRWLEIPPLQEHVTAVGLCKGSCTSTIMDGPIYITDALNHMHYLGISQRTLLNKTDSALSYDLAWDRVFNYDSPVTHRYSDPVRMDPGDQLVTSCTFKSTSRTYTTYYGESTNEEMCFSFLTYYPKSNLRIPWCVSNLDIGMCDLYFSRVVNGCDLKMANNYSHPETTSIINKVMSKCIPTSCQLECLEVAREIKQHPCFKGSVTKMLRKQAHDRLSSGGTIDELMWYLRLDSCDRELALEECDQTKNNQKGNDVSAASAFKSHGIIGTILASMIWCLLKS